MEAPGNARYLPPILGRQIVDNNDDHDNNNNNNNFTV